MYMATKRNGMREKKLERRGEVVSNGQKHLASFFTETPMKCMQPTLEQLKPGRYFALFIGVRNRILPFLNLWHFVLKLRMKNLSVVL